MMDSIVVDEDLMNILRRHQEAFDILMRETTTQIIGCRYGINLDQEDWTLDMENSILIHTETKDEAGNQERS